MRAPLNLRKWIDEHRDLLKPPVGNAQIWEDGRLHRHAGRRPQPAHRLPRRPARGVLLPAHGRHGAADHGGRRVRATCRSAPATCSCCRRTCAIRRSVPTGQRGPRHRVPQAAGAASTPSSGIACNATRACTASKCSSRASCATCRRCSSSSMATRRCARVPHAGRCIRASADARRSTSTRTSFRASRARRPLQRDARAPWLADTATAPATSCRATRASVRWKRACGTRAARLRWMDEARIDDAVRLRDAGHVRLRLGRRERAAWCERMNDRVLEFCAADHASPEGAGAGAVAGRRRGLPRGHARARGRPHRRADRQPRGPKSLDDPGASSTSCAIARASRCRCSCIPGT